MKITALIASALFALVSLTACDTDNPPGVVNDVKNAGLTDAVGKCPFTWQWSISVDPDGHENESIDARSAYRYTVCMSEDEAKTYKSGDRYPREK